MTEILAFILGVSAVAFAWVVVVAFKTVRKSKEIDQSFSGHREWISANDQAINRRVDQEMERVDNIYNDCIRHTDSRVDKLEQKYLDQTQAKQVLKG